jgi:hypothetical protein
MAKFHLDFLRKKHGYTGGRLTELMGKILGVEAENTVKRVAELNRTHWTKAAEKVTTARKIVVPEMKDFIHSRSYFSNKSAQNGTIIGDTLRDALTAKLRDRMKTWTTETGTPNLVRLKGKAKGEVNPRLIKAFERDISEVYSGYTKRDPKLGMPTNVHAIAVTEVRSTVNGFSRQYASALQDKNPALRVLKKWRHDDSLSKQSRPGHKALNGRVIGLPEKFHVKEFRRRGNRWIPTGRTIDMDGPHDPTAPPDQTICCSCSQVILARAT